MTNRTINILSKKSALRSSYHESGMETRLPNPNVSDHPSIFTNLLDFSMYPSFR